MPSGEGRCRVRLPDVEYYRALVPCALGCPVGTLAGGYVRAIAEGRDRDAYDLASGPNPFASVCARVCAHPCESECRRGRFDLPVSIRALKRFVTERHGVESRTTRPSFPDPPAGEETRGRVAVVGAGPAGLSCAHDLIRAGVAVTVLEASTALGGMLGLGIPEYRLPRDILNLETFRTLLNRADLRTNMRLGRDFSVASLLASGYDAVFLGIGTHRGRGLSIPGADLDGVVNGIEFLLNVSLGYRVEVGRRVVVVGGGNVAVDVARVTLRQEEEEGESRPGELSKTMLDAARSAVRLGAREVHMVCLERREEMPAYEEEVEEAVREGVVLHPSRGPKSILSEDGRRAAGLETLACERVFDEEGRFAPRFRAGSEEVIRADTLVLAIGQQADDAAFELDPDLERRENGLLRFDPETLETTVPGVYAGGDAAFGPRTVIAAVADGRRAARSILRRLRGEVEVPPRAARFLPGGRRLPRDPHRLSREEYRSVPRVAVPCEPVARRTGFREVEQGYDEAEARREAGRCLRCEIQTVFDSEACILCGGCVDVCPQYCLRIFRPGEVAGGEEVEALLEVRRGGEEDAPLAGILKNEDPCIRCGLCAERCPTGAITMELFELEDSVHGW